MGCDYWKIMEITIENMENFRLITTKHEFSIEPCNFYDIEVDYNNCEATCQRKHAAKVAERLRAICIPDPANIYSNGSWNPDYLHYKNRIEKLVEDKQNIKRILLKTYFQIC